METKKRLDIIIAVVVLVIGAIVYISSQQYPGLSEGHPGPGLFPSVVGLCMIFAGGLMGYVALKGGDGDTTFAKGNWISILLILTIMVAFPFLKNLTGFLTAISVVLLLVALLMRLTIIKALLVSLLTTGFIYLVFAQILHVPL